MYCTLVTASHPKLSKATHVSATEKPTVAGSPLHHTQTCSDVNSATCRNAITQNKKPSDREYGMHTTGTNMQHGQAAQPPGKRRLFRRWNDEDLLPYRIEKEFKAPTLENQQNLKTHGRVVLAKDASNDMVVIKIFEKSNNGLRNQPKYLDSFRKEMKFQALAAKGSHPAVPTIFKTIETKETLFFGTPSLYATTNLSSLIKPTAFGLVPSS